MSEVQREAPQDGATDVPTFYADGVQFSMQVYDLLLLFTLQRGPDVPPEPIARVHLSPQLAKVVGRLMRRNIKAYEEQTGASIHLPAGLLSELKIEDLDE